MQNTKMMGKNLNVYVHEHTVVLINKIEELGLYIQKSKLIVKGNCQSTIIYLW